MLATVPFLGLVLVIVILGLPDISRGGRGSAGLGSLTVDQLESILVYLFPSEAYLLVREQIARIQHDPPWTLLSIGAAIALWSSSSLFLAVIDSLNLTHGVKETRSFIRLRVTAMAMTLIQAACLIGSLLAILAWPLILKWLHVNPDGPAAWVATFVRWSAVVALVLASFAITFYVGPNVQRRCRWITPGSLAGTVGFLIFCALFRLYVEHFRSYDRSLGALGGVMVLLLWYWGVALVFIAAAEIDRTIEASTTR
jgi:membrane protein